MKIRFRHSAGSVIIVVLITTILIGVTLGSYLHMVSNQNLSIMRSMAWNTAISVAEGGIEEAMAHLNTNGTNRVRDGWTVDGTNVVKEKLIGENKYRVYISKDVDPPIIIAEGHVRNPKDNQFLPRPRIVRVGTTNAAFPCIRTSVFELRPQ